MRLLWRRSLLKCRCLGCDHVEKDFKNASRSNIHDRGCCADSDSHSRIWGYQIMAYSNKTGLPSPSNILRPWIDVDFFTEEGRERGSKVHAACANHLTGKYVIIEKQYRGYFDSFCRWCDDEQPDAIVVEQRLVDPLYGYCGQPDLICSINNRPGIGVPDIKTGATLGKAWPLACAGYRHLADVNVEKTVWGSSIRLKPDGSYPLVKFYPNYETDFNMFLSALNLYRHFN